MYLFRLFVLALMAQHTRQVVHTFLADQRLEHDPPTQDRDPTSQNLPSAPKIENLSQTPQELRSELAIYPIAANMSRACVYASG